MSADLPEPDRLLGVPHPRETAQLLGQEAAEATFLEAYATGRLHHGWMLTGPKGVGKATLAWRMARFLLATPQTDGNDMFGAPPPPTTLDISDDHPVARRMAAGAEPGLFVLKRSPNDKGDRLSAEIRVDDVRKLKGFFSLSVADGGRRVVIVDAADELNVNAANAILKLLEEPPAKTILILIVHQPSRLLPTIRSRCRVLRCATLTPDALAQAMAQAGVETDQPDALAALAAGSVGTAIQMETQDGVKLYQALVGLFSGLPMLDRNVATKLADTVSARDPARMALLLDLFDIFLARVARSGAAGPPSPEAAQGEAELFARLAPNPAAAREWAALAQTLGDRARRGASVNLDPPSLILDMVLKIEAEAPTTS